MLQIWLAVTQKSCQSTEYSFLSPRKQYNAFNEFNKQFSLSTFILKTFKGQLHPGLPSTVNEGQRTFLSSMNSHIS